MSADPLERLARRASVRRALALGAVSVAIIVAVEARAATEPAPRSALGTPDLARAVAPAPSGSSGPAGAQSSPPPPRPHKSTKAARHAAAPTPKSTSSKSTSSKSTSSKGTPTKPSPTTSPVTTAAPVSPVTAPRVTKAAPTTTRVITGAAYDVSYGLVQVRITVQGSRILEVTAVSLPQGGRSSDISAMAGPVLRREAIAAQSAKIDAVSGASYTSAGYAKSLQSALDKAAG